MGTRAVSHRDQEQRRRQRKQAAVGTVGVLAAAALVLALAWWAWSWSGGGRDTLAGWVEAAATMAAFLAAATAALFAAGAFRLEHEREGRRLDLDRRAQAALVAAWFETGRQPAGLRLGGRSHRTYMPSEVLFVRLRNASDLPVMNVTVNVFSMIKVPEGVSKSEDLPVVREEDRAEMAPEVLPGERLVYLAEVVRPVLPPADQPLEIQLASEARQLLGATLDELREVEHSSDVMVTVHFTDASGASWVRTTLGDLVEVPNRGPLSD